MIQCNNKYQQWDSDGPKNGIITFFTPTFNRSKFLPRLYEGMQKQTCKDFVWIIVNDGSSDNTDDVASNLLAKEEIPIMYISKPNGGKHSAFKAAFDQAQTEYFICMDDDDIYKPESVETFLRLWTDIENAGDKSIGAIRTLVLKTDGTYASNVKVSEDGSFIDRTTLEQKFIFKIHQENWTCYKTECLRAIDLFPTGYWLSDQHTFYSEGLWQSRFARRFKCRYVNTVLRLYTNDADTSLIRSNKRRQHYLNMFINTKLNLDENLDFIRKDKKSLFKGIAIISILRHKLNIPFSELISHSQNTKIKIYYMLMFPFCWLSKKPYVPSK